MEDTCDFILFNPLWSWQRVGETPILNSLLISFGLPMLWVGAISQKDFSPLIQKHKNVLRNSILVLAFALVSLEVRQFFHGTLLNKHITSDLEIYAYSAVWLLSGIALLFFGTLRQNKTLRAASLAVMLLTVGKVFLYDASELTGLWRVFSFFGLGLCLLGLSWFYSRFVFITKKGRA